MKATPKPVPKASKKSGFRTQSRPCFCSQCSQYFYEVTRLATSNRRFLILKPFRKTIETPMEKQQSPIWGGQQCSLDGVLEPFWWCRIRLPPMHQWPPQSDGEREIWERSSPETVVAALIPGRARCSKGGGKEQAAHSRKKRRAERWDRGPGVCPLVCWQVCDPTVLRSSVFPSVRLYSAYTCWCPRYLGWI